MDLCAQGKWHTSLTLVCAGASEEKEYQRKRRNGESGLNVRTEDSWHYM